MAPKKKAARADVPASAPAAKSTGKKARKAKAEPRAIVMHNGALHFQNDDGSHTKCSDAEIRAHGFEPPVQ